MKERNHFVDLLRGMGIVFMIMGHIGFGSKFDLWSHAFHMPLFFLVSGYFLPGRQPGFGEFLRHKARKLLVPYFFTAAFCAGTAFYLYRSGKLILHVEEHLRDIFLYPSTGDIPISGALWFLTALFWVQIIYYLIQKACGDRPGLTFAASAVISLTGMVLIQRFRPPIPFGLDSAIGSLVFFGTGHMLKKLEPRIGSRIRTEFWLVFPDMALLLISCLLIWKNGYVNFRSCIYGRPLLCWFNAVSVTLLLWHMCRCGESLRERITVFRYPLDLGESIGRNSLTYLCSNQLVITLLNVYVLQNMALPHYFGKFFALGLTILFCLVIDLIRRKKKVFFTLVILLAVAAGMHLCLGADKSGEQTTCFLNRNLDYVLNIWWPGEKKYALSGSSNISGLSALTAQQEELVRRSRESFSDWKHQEYLYLAIHEDKNKAENAIRPIGHACFILASALKYGYYNEKITGVAKEDAQEMLLLLIRSAAKAYDEGRWGQSWQSALWAENIGFAAFLSTDHMTAEDRRLVDRMVQSEAEYVMEQCPPLYYKDPDGNELYAGDTKAEEVAWDSKILALAVCMYPEDTRVPEWELRLEQMLIAATSMPGDAESTAIVDGIRLCDFVEGSNINADGTLTNHGRCHIDYMTTTVQEMVDTQILYLMAGEEPPEASTFNVDRIYEALVNVDLGDYDPEKAGRHFYVRDERGRPTRYTDMPGTNDWGGQWYGSFYLTDTYVDILQLDSRIEADYKASVWRDLHFAQMKDMIRCNPRGNFYKEGEDNFVSGELFQMHNFTKAYLLELLTRPD